MESRHDKFVRLAEGRVNKAIDSIRSIAKLSNRNHYDFSPEEVKSLISALRIELDEMKSKFDTSLAAKDKNRFKFEKLGEK